VHQCECTRTTNRHVATPILTHTGIKVALPCESASGRCFLQLYIETILALQV
jgi:hypothetical protein